MFNALAFTVVIASAATMFTFANEILTPWA